MSANPYLFFEGRCEEALAFYGKVLGAKVEMLMRYSDNPDSPPPGQLPPGSDKKVMHAAFRVGATALMGSDGMCQGSPKFQGFALSHEVANAAEADRVFAALAEGGQVQMPLATTFFSPRFGMVADRFGLTWMVIVPQAMPAKT